MSLRAHLLLWFMLFAAFATLLGIVFTLLFLKKKNETHQKLEQLNQYHLEMVRLKNFQQNFFTYDTRTPAFYVKESSGNLEAYRTQATALFNKIEKEQNNTDQLSYDTLMTELRTMDSLFSAAIKLSLQVGYKDFGIIGEMRKHIHILENFPQIDQTKILSLRRHEKDYIIRNEEIYIENFQRLYKRLLPEVEENQKLSKEQKALVLPALKLYHQKFIEFTSLNGQIGDRNQGYIKQLSIANGRLNEELTVLKNQATVIQSNEQRQIAMMYGGVLMLLIASAILATWYVSGRLIRPIQKVINRISGIQESENFENPLPPFYSRCKELNNLYSSFNQLLNKLCEQREHRNSISLKMMNRLNLHKDILDSLGIIVFTCNEDGKISFANHHFHVFSGYTDDDLEAGLYLDEILVEVSHKIDNKEIKSFYYTLICKDNSFKKVLIDINSNSALNYKTGVLVEQEKLFLHQTVGSEIKSVLPLLPEPGNN